MDLTSKEPELKDVFYLEHFLELRNGIIIDCLSPIHI